MKKRTWLTLFTVCFVISPSYSQVRKKTDGPLLFRGVVIDAVTQSRLSSSRITINRVATAVSREDGTFSFYVYKSDTVIFSMLGYKSSTFVVSDTLSGKEFLAGVYLETDTLSAGEVIIVPRLTNLRTELLNGRIESDTRLDNARNNISIAAYQGLNSQDKLGDPDINYELLRQKQKINAFEKGGIPSDRIAGISSLILLPAYFLIHGLPETPHPPEPHITVKDIDELQRKYFESMKNRK